MDRLNHARRDGNRLLPQQWSPVGSPPQTSNGLLYLTVPTTNNSQEFFRLGTP
jgi:hypothetical protein